MSHKTYKALDKAVTKFIDATGAVGDIDQECYGLTDLTDQANFDVTVECEGSVAKGRKAAIGELKLDAKRALMLLKAIAKATDDLIETIPLALEAKIVEISAMEPTADSDDDQDL